MKYFQTDDLDDYFASLSKDKKPRTKVFYNITKDDLMIHKSIPNYKCLSFTKTLIDKTRKQLKNNKWMQELINLGYTVTNVKQV